MRPSFHLCAALVPLLLAACSSTPGQPSYWPVTVVPDPERPGSLTALPLDCENIPARVPKIVTSPWHERSLGIGCSNAGNLGAMIDDPRDLLVGRATAPADAEREAAAVLRYHKGEEKRIQREGARGD